MRQSWQGISLNAASTVDAWCRILRAQRSQHTYSMVSLSVLEAAPRAPIWQLVAQLCMRREVGLSASWSSIKLAMLSTCFRGQIAIHTQFGYAFWQFIAHCNLGPAANLTVTCCIQGKRLSVDLIVMGADGSMVLQASHQRSILCSLSRHCPPSILAAVVCSDTQDAITHGLSSAADRWQLCKRVCEGDAEMITRFELGQDALATH